MSPDRYRSSAARDHVRAIRKAGGTVERTGKGRLKVTGPSGEVTIQEPSSQTRPDLARNAAAVLRREQTGLEI